MNSILTASDLQLRFEFAIAEAALLKRMELAEAEIAAAKAELQKLRARQIALERGARPKQQQLLEFCLEQILTKVRNDGKVMRSQDRLDIKLPGELDSDTVAVEIAANMKEFGFTIEYFPYEAGASRLSERDAFLRIIKD